MVNITGIQGYQQGDPLEILDATLPHREPNAVQMLVSKHGAHFSRDKSQRGR